jgi:hypothetical protein
MITLNISTSKKELLDELARLADKGGSELYLKIESLPTFLTTPISFTVFNYQISNYPREIIWASEHAGILNFLENCNVRMPDLSQYNDNGLVKADKNKYPNKSLDIPARSVINPHLSLHQKSLSKQDSKHAFQGYSNYNDFDRRDFEKHFIKKPQKNKPLVEDTSHLYYQRQQNEYFQKQKEITENGFEEQIQQENHSLKNPPILLDDNSFPTRRFSLSAENLLEGSNYQRSTLLEKDSIDKKINNIQNQTHGFMSGDDILNNYQQESIFKNQEDNENLNNWLNRIESTKKALEKIQKNDYSDKEEEYSTAKSLNPSILKNKINWASFSLTSLLLTLLIVGFISFFPTKVYTINVGAISKNQTADIKIPLTRFNTQELTLETTLERTLETNATQEVDRAIGQVRIVNSSGGAIAFDRTGIILTASNGKTYRQVAQDGDPGTYRLPGGGGSTTITIQATENGANSILEVGQTLSLSNLKRDSLGNRIQATVTQKVNNIIETGDKVVTESNYNSLKAQAQDEFVKQREAEIDKIDTDLHLVNYNWYKDFSTDHIFSDEVGATTDKITLEAKANTEILYLSKITLEEIIRNNFPEIKELQKVEIAFFEGSFNNINQDLILNLDFTYIEKNNIDQSLVSKTLSEKNFDLARQDLIQKYPHITEINETINGLQMPGVPTKLEIEIQED